MARRPGRATGESRPPHIVCQAPPATRSLTRRSAPARAQESGSVPSECSCSLEYDSLPWPRAGESLSVFSVSLRPPHIVCQAPPAHRSLTRSTARAQASDSVPSECSCSLEYDSLPWPRAGQSLSVFSVNLRPPQRVPSSSSSPKLDAKPTARARARRMTLFPVSVAAHWRMTRCLATRRGITLCVPSECSRHYVEKRLTGVWLVALAARRGNESRPPHIVCQAPPAHRSLTRSTTARAQACDSVVPSECSRQPRHREAAHWSMARRPGRATGESRPPHIVCQAPPAHRSLTRSTTARAQACDSVVPSATTSRSSSLEYGSSPWPRAGESLSVFSVSLRPPHIVCQAPPAHRSLTRSTTARQQAIDSVPSE
jgi:hypothetical protein